MATTRLYPPILAGTTPPFFDTVDGTILVVPFSMNIIVSSSEVGGVKLRIRNASNDQELGYIDAYEWSNSAAYFNLEDIKNALILASYYKIQLAYVDTYNNVGYYSTLSIVKYTARPTVAIVGLNGYQPNLHSISYTGIYSNLADPSEKSHQYRFTLYDMKDNVIQTSDWQVHNTNNDTTSWQSTDSYMLNYTINPDEKYKLQYSVITNNNLKVDSIMYLITGQSIIPPDIDVVVNAECDYDEGNITIRLSLPVDIFGEEVKPQENYSGAFLIARSSSADNFRSWIQLATFRLGRELNRDVLYRDFTAEQGETYIYCIQQFNSSGLYSARICSKPVVSGFEDAFLYDGERQLKIRFNPKVSSFKSVLQENKKNTLGSKYPFFFRNGRVNYKEFPISGLISYLSDDNSYFMSRTEELNMPVDWDDITDITDENLLYERRFKLKVLDWLNNGEIKLFRSPGEGNYLVRLSNISLSPIDTVSRMLHTFSCTADEIDDCNPTTLSRYGFYNDDISVTKQLQYYTINFQYEIDNMINTGFSNISQTLTEPSDSTIEQALNLFSKTDLLYGDELQYVKFEGCPGLEFIIGGQYYVVGSTGSYEMLFSDTQQVLRLPRMSKSGTKENITRGMTGQVTVGVWKKFINKFNNAQSVSQYDRIDFPVFDRKNYMEQFNTLYSYGSTSGDLTVKNVKDKITLLHRMKFTLLTVDPKQEYSSLEEFLSASHFNLTEVASNVWNITLTDESGGTKTLVEHNKTVSNPVQLTFREGYVLIIGGTDYYQIRGSQLVKLSPITVTINTIDDDGNIKQETKQLQPDDVCIDDEISKVTGLPLVFPTGTPIPKKQLYWGQLVQPELIYQLTTVKYDVEDKTTNVPGLPYSLSQTSPKLQVYLQAQAAKTLDYLCVANESFINSDLLTRQIYYNNTNSPQNPNEDRKEDIVHLTPVNQLSIDGNSSFVTIEHLVANNAQNDYDLCSLFYWDVNHFCRMSREEQAAFSGNMVWIPRTETNLAADNYVAHNDNGAEEQKFIYYRDLNTELSHLNDEGG